MIVHCKLPKSPEPTAQVIRNTGSASEKKAAQIVRGLGARFIRVRFVEQRIIIHYWPESRKAGRA